VKLRKPSYGDWLKKANEWLKSTHANKRLPVALKKSAKANRKPRKKDVKLRNYCEHKLHELELMGIPHDPAVFKTLSHPTETTAIP
jgi:hypothetical protein